jgi:hypothetical protein
VSFSGQYRLAYTARHLAVVAGLAAAIPDATALMFVCLGVALALDTVGHETTHATETVYRHVIVPAIRGGATVMDDVFGAEDEENA